MLSPHPRHFILHVTEVEAPPYVSEDGGDGDFVEIRYAGKIFPSTQERIAKAFADGQFEQKERRLA
jgi:hypothetical protein